MVIGLFLLESHNAKLKQLPDPFVLALQITVVGGNNGY